MSDSNELTTGRDTSTIAQNPETNQGSLHTCSLNINLALRSSHFQENTFLNFPPPTRFTRTMQTTTSNRSPTKQNQNMKIIVWIKRAVGREVVRFESATWTREQAPQDQQSALFVD
jgi:hypothetical protein